MEQRTLYADVRLLVQRRMCFRPCLLLTDCGPPMTPTEARRYNSLSKIDAVRYSMLTFADFVTQSVFVEKGRNFFGYLLAVVENEIARVNRPAS